MTVSQSKANQHHEWLMAYKLRKYNGPLTFSQHVHLPINRSNGPSVSRQLIVCSEVS